MKDIKEAAHGGSEDVKEVDYAGSKEEKEVAHVEDNKSDVVQRHAMNNKRNYQQQSYEHMKDCVEIT